MAACGKKRSEIWNYFRKIGNMKAKCSQCETIISYKGGYTHNMSRHFVKKHSEINNLSIENEDSNVEVLECDAKTPSVLKKDLKEMEHIDSNTEKSKVSSIEKTSTRRRSKVWKYFSSIKDENANCNLCHQTLSFKGGSIKNLKRHLIKKHPGIYEHSLNNSPINKFEISLIDSDITTNSSISKFSTTGKTCSSFQKSKRWSKVWNFFSSIKDENANCNLCHKTLSFKGGSIKNLKRHLIKRHPGIDERSLKSDITTNSSISKLSTTRKICTRFQKSKRRSKVWNFFSSIKDEKASCSLCHNTLSFKGGYTRNLKRHLVKKHPGIYEKSLNSSPLNSNINNIEISQTDELNTNYESLTHSDFSTKSSISKFSRLESQLEIIRQSEETCLSGNLNKEESIHRQLVKMIVKSYYHISIVEDEEFVNLLKLLNSEYNPPNENYLSTFILPQFYSEKRVEIQSKIKYAKAVSLTLDGWISNTNENYLAVTCHYLNEDFKLQTYLLDCFEFDTGNQAARNINGQLKQVINEWDLQGKIIAIVSEESADMIAAIGKGNWQHITCFGKKLNLIAQKIISDDMVSSLKSKISKIIRYAYKKSTVLSNIHFQDIIVPKTELTWNDSDRWNSTLQMFSQYLELKESTDFVSLMNGEFVLPDHVELKIIEKICSILKIFEDIANEICKETIASLSEFKIFVKALGKFIRTKLENEDDSSIRNLLKNILIDINEMFDIYNLPFSELYLESSLLDPRFKKLAFNEKDNFDCIIENVVQKAAKFNFSKQSEQTICSQKKTSNVLWAEFDELATKCENPLNISDTRIEINHYLLEPLLDRTMDPLLWWQKRQSIYPHICELMKQRLTIPATSVPGQTLFSKNGQIITDRRSQLSSADVRKLVFLHSNL